MAIFICVTVDECIQQGDKIPIDLTGTYATPDEADITSYQIEPEAGAGFIDVTEDKQLCWSYASAGNKVISIIVTNGVTVANQTVDVVVKTEEDDCLFSDDSCLIPFETEILKLLPCDRCSFIYIHRQVKQCILDCLAKMDIDDCGVPLTVEQIKASADVKKAATYWALELIFQTAYTKPGDKFDVKWKHYRKLREGVFNSGLSFDTNENGTIENNEIYSGLNKRLVRV